MDVTVAICTWNRCSLLERTLAEMARLEIPPGLQWELLVVDNNCTDDTRQVIRRHAGRLPMRAVSEPRPGLSHARNRAVNAARGKLLLWTDDDVLVDPQWLSAYCESAARYPKASFFGGPILPWFEREPPRWITEMLVQFCGVFAIRDLGDQPFEFDGEQLPFGANFGIRTETQRRHLYNPQLGRTQNQMVSGEETLVLQRMLAAGQRGMWVPEARVRHFIPAGRMTPGYVRRYYYGLGQTEVLTSGSSHLPSRYWLCTQALLSELKWRARRGHRDSERWVKHLIRSSLYWGQVSRYGRSAA